MFHFVNLSLFICSSCHVLCNRYYTTNREMHARIRIFRISLIMIDLYPNMHLYCKENCILHYKMSYQQFFNSTAKTSYLYNVCYQKIGDKGHISKQLLNHFCVSISYLIVRTITVKKDKRVYVL